MVRIVEERDREERRVKERREREKEMERACMRYHDTHLNLCHVHSFHFYLHD